MAVLTLVQLAEARSNCAGYNAAATVPLNYTKGQVNAAVQAVEDWFESNRAAVGAVIDTATAPLVLSVAQKTQLVRAWLLSKHLRGG